MTDARPDGEPQDTGTRWSMRLYVAGNGASSLRAIKNLKDICTKYLQDQAELEIIDLLQHPELASEHQILAIPTLVRKQPSPVRKVIGDLSATDKVLVVLEIDAEPE